MTDEQWDKLISILNGDVWSPTPAGFLVDAPWFCGVMNLPLMEYFTDTGQWLEANLQATRRFPDVLLLPGFWAEFGMISNPPSFGARCVWPEDGFPSCQRVLHSCDEIDRLEQPNVSSDGLLPLLTQRLKQSRSAIEAAGHRIRFACSHGPITIASYLLGHNEFFLACRTDTEAIERLLEKTTRFVIDWLAFQKAQFASIDGVLILEDLMGFVGEQDFVSLVLPRMKQIFRALAVRVRFLHNDAYGLITARHLTEMGVNLFNFSFQHDLNEVRRLAGDGVTLMGNVPPRDILGLGTAQHVYHGVAALLETVSDRRRLIVSAGGFTPATFGPEKIAAFCRAVAETDGASGHG